MNFSQFRDFHYFPKTKKNKTQTYATTNENPPPTSLSRP
jgi:hypothetical protein